MLCHYYNYITIDWHNRDGSKQINEGIFVSTYIHILYIHIYMVCVYLHVYTSCIHTCRCKYISMVFSWFGLVNVCQHKVKLIQVHLTRLVLRCCTKAFVVIGCQRWTGLVLHSSSSGVKAADDARGEPSDRQCALRRRRRKETELQLQRSGFPLPRNEKGGKATCRRGGKKKKQYANTAGPEPMQTNIL